jgi:hypothetical protein
MSTEAPRSARELQMLEGLVDSAYALAQSCHAAAMAEAGAKPSLEFLDGFLKCSLAVRMGIRLCMTLRAPPGAASATASTRAHRDPPDREPPGDDPPEHEPGERERIERERERDYEPVSLPRFLATLGVVARDAQRLGDRLPGASHVLPTLKGLLAQAAADRSDPEPAPSSASSSAGVAVLTRPSPRRTRHSLLGSAAAPRPAPFPGAPPPWPNSG